MDDEILEWIKESIRSAAPPPQVNYDDAEIRLVGVTKHAVIIQGKRLDETKIVRVEFSIEEI